MKSRDQLGPAWACRSKPLSSPKSTDLLLCWTATVPVPSGFEPFCRRSRRPYMSGSARSMTPRPRSEHSRCNILFGLVSRTDDIDSRSAGLAEILSRCDAGHDG
jgi:hypothetical protein